MKDTVIVISGSRSYTGLPLIVTVLDTILNNLTDVNVKLREGGAKGVDSLGREYAAVRNIACETQRADWKNLEVYPCIVKTYSDGSEYNALAGMIRNEAMIAKDDVGLVTMFSWNKSSGTADAKKHSIKYGKNYIFIDINGNSVELGIKGRKYKIMSYKDFLDGGYVSWLQLVEKNI